MVQVKIPNLPGAFLVKRVFVCLLCLLIFLQLTMAPEYSFGQPPGGRGGPPGRGENRPPEVDSERDFNLLKMKTVLELDRDQIESVVARYKKLRSDQFIVVQEVNRGGFGNDSGPPSPEMRAKQETKLKEKVDPLNALFVADIRAVLNESQRAKFAEVVDELELYPVRGAAQAEALNTPFQLKNSVKFEEVDGLRVVTANGIPDYIPGVFPGRGNPAAITEQRYVFRMPLKPTLSATATPHRRLLAGVALNGVVFDPGTAEMWRNDPRSGWRQEAISPLTISGAKMGLDASNAHVQPSGAYHYHALPTGLVKRLAKEKGLKVGDAMIQIGWSPDGFPIYDYHCYSKADDATSPIKEMHSSYRLRQGNRPDENATPPGPGGAFDGTYTQDFEYVAGSGDLDECNGRYGVTPEFPQGTYYYVVTGEFPYISRMFRGTPNTSFAKNVSHQGVVGPGERRVVGNRVDLKVDVQDLADLKVDDQDQVGLLEGVQVQAPGDPAVLRIQMDGRHPSDEVSC